MNDKEREELYNRIKKRLGDYRYRSGFFTLGAMIFAFLFILSVFPLVPIALIAILRLEVSDWSVPLWFISIAVFGVLLWIFQGFAKKIEEKRGITLEERMYVHGYEALCHLREYFDPNHPIISGKLKAKRRVRDVLTLLGEFGLPNATIIRAEVVEMWKLTQNLRYRLIPSIKNMPQSDPKVMEATYLTVADLVDYLSKPELPSLEALNKRMTSLQEIKERSIYDDFRSTLFKRSNLRHVMAGSVASVVALLIYSVDLNYLGASQHDAFTLGVGSLIALVTLYATYLGLTVRREQRT